MQKRRYQFAMVAAIAGVVFCLLWWNRPGTPVNEKQEIAAREVEPKEAQPVAETTRPQPDSELLRLRGEVAVLRAAAREQTNKTVPTNSLSVSDRFVSSDQFADIGFATPESAIQTICWAAFTTNRERYKQAIVWGDEVIKIARQQQRHGFDTNKVFPTVSNSGGHTRAFEILELRPIATDQMRATIFIVRGDDISETREKRHMDLINVNGEWKWFVPSPADVGIIPFIADQ